MKISVTKKAKRFIKNQGGELYIILRKIQCT